MATPQNIDITIVPRTSIHDIEYGDPVNVSKYLTDKGRGTITSKFDETSYRLSPGNLGTWDLKLINKGGMFSGASTYRSIFSLANRENAIVYVSDFFSGLVTEKGSKDKIADNTSILKCRDLSSILKTREVPNAALRPGIPAREFIRRCVDAARNDLPPAYNPFYTYRDETFDNFTMTNLIIDRPSIIPSPQLF